MGHGVQHCDASVEYEGQITIAKQTLQPKLSLISKSRVLSGYRLNRECLGGWRAGNFSIGNSIRFGCFRLLRLWWIFWLRRMDIKL